MIRSKIFKKMGIILLLGLLIRGASVSITSQKSENNLEKDLFDETFEVQLPSKLLVLGYDPNMYNTYIQENGRFPNSEVSFEMMQEIGDLSFVKNHDYFLEIAPEIQDINQYWISEELKDEMENWGMAPFMVRGTPLPEIIDVSTGIIEIIEGRTFTADEIVNGYPVVILSQELADLNQLSVGSTIVISSSSIENNEQSFEIVGLFESKLSREIDNDDWTLLIEENDILNRLYLPNEMVAPMIEDEIKLDWTKNQALYKENYGEDFDLNDDGMEQLFNSRKQFFYLLNDINDFQAFRDVATDILPEPWSVVPK